MKNSNLILVTLMLLTLNGCDDDDSTGNSENPPSGSNVVVITDDITEVTTWYADSVYVIQDNNFWVENTLTIQAGTVIKFTYNGPGMSVANGGTVNAVGTSSKPIIFTSYKDDAHGGDNNGDGVVTTPSVKDWGIIWVEGNGSQFVYCNFYYGGKSSYPATLLFFDVNGTITNCVFAHNYGNKSGDFYYGALSTENADPDIIIKNNIFYDNHLPLSIPCENNLDASNIFHNPDSVSETNTMNGIFTYAYDDFTRSTTWSETEVPNVINDGDLYIEVSWILANNVIVKFTPGSAIIKEPTATFTYHSSNIFTSFKDDAHGGDTNGDGNTSPSNGDWWGMAVNDGSTTPICGTNILYADNCH